jgi:hypothetical protein
MYASVFTGHMLLCWLEMAGVESSPGPVSDGEGAVGCICLCVGACVRAWVGACVSSIQPTIHQNPAYTSGTSYSTAHVHSHQPLPHLQTDHHTPIVERCSLSQSLQAQGGNGEREDQDLLFECLQTIYTGPYYKINT